MSLMYSYESLTMYHRHVKTRDTLFFKIQRRATKLIPLVLSYEERLKECGLTTLETRQLWGDHIEVFQILNGHENIDCNIYFQN